MQNEHDRIVAVYEARYENKNQGQSFYAYQGLHHLIRVQERHRETLRLMYKAGLRDLAALDILDVGCGNGNMLRQFVEWGGDPKRVHGIELFPQAVEDAHRLNAELDVRAGSAVALPWETASMDLVCQHTVFTSILQPDMRRTIADEMKRVLRPGGSILWYDFSYDNPRNPDVHGVKQAEIEALFAGYSIQLKRITLAPPLARRIPQIALPVVYPMLASLPFLCTHWLGIFKSPQTST